MKLSFLLLLLCNAAVVVAQQRDDLARSLRQRVSEFPGRVGLYVRHLDTGQEVAINADSLFPTASMIKIPITIGIFNKIEKGELSYDSVLTYRDSLASGVGEDILASFRDGEKISLAKVLMLMITTSDNTASIWSQAMAGGGTEINAWLEENGFTHTRVNSRTPERDAAWKRYGWGQTTPREMASLVTMIRNNKVISPRASERIYRNLTRIYWDGSSLSQLPPYVQAASKTGSLDRYRAEVVLVNAPHGDYVFCVIANDMNDTRWTRDNAGNVLLRDVSRILWNHFEPDSGWKPAEGSEEWF
jgi:beta-lactamase class A